MLPKSSKIYVAGHRGMVGSACLRLLENSGYNNLIYKDSSELDLTNQKLVEEFFINEKPDVVIIAAAKVGGIYANDTYGYDFLMNNMLIQNNLLYYSNIYNVTKLVFLGSSCIYPKFANQPIKEKSLLTGPLEETNQWYAIAKISGVKTVESLNKYKNKNYVCLMPTNLYGPNDNYNLLNSHVLPALIRKIHEAKVKNQKHVTLWGDGSPLREFLHVDDLANAILFALNNPLSDSIYNVGSGNEISIYDLSSLVSEIIDFKGEIIWDNNKPNGTPRKILDSSKLNSLGWKPNISLKAGIKDTYLKLKDSNFNFDKK